MVDRARSIATRLGARPFRVFLVWTISSGDKRGDGDEKILERHEIQPRPRCDFASLTRNPTLVGVYAAGSVRVDEITPAYTLDELQGVKLPNGRPVPVDRGRVSFFYEVTEDGRGDDPPSRGRFRLNNVPAREAENVQWVIILEPVSDAMRRDGRPDRPGVR